MGRGGVRGRGGSTGATSTSVADWLFELDLEDAVGFFETEDNFEDTEVAATLGFDWDDLLAADEETWVETEEAGLEVEDVADFNGFEALAGTDDLLDDDILEKELDVVLLIDFVLMENSFPL